VSILGDSPTAPTNLGGGGSAPALTPDLDAHDLVVLPLTETSGDYTNRGSVGGTWTRGSNNVRVAPSGRFGGGVAYDGSTSSWVRGASSVAPASLTLWAWVRPIEASGSATVILGKSTHPSEWNDPWWVAELGFDGGGFRPHGQVSSGAGGSLVTLRAPSNRALSANSEALLGMTFDGATGVQKLWIDGVEVATATRAFSLGYTSGVQWSSGSVWSGSGDPLNGQVFRMGICDIARPASWWGEVYRRGIGTYR
jgi:Concanavalin A-like lectin/glucanases superfamily